MSHAFSSSSQDPASQRLSAEEARELIRGYAEPVVALDRGFTVEDLAETLSISNEQAQEMVRNLRARQKTPQPMPNNVWLRTRLWIWVVLALISLSLSGFGIMGFLADRAANFGGLDPNRRLGNGIYSRSVAEQGRALGAHAPPGFSYRIQFGTMDAGVNGDSKNYIEVEDLSPENVAILQKQMVENIMNALSSAVAKEKPSWVEGKAPAVIIPNYYPGGEGIPFDVTLDEKAFPYKPDSAEGQQVRKAISDDLQQNWNEIIDL